MMSFVDDFVAKIISLEVSLYHSRARLQANSDSEALHDLGIAVRKIRSLLRPLRNMPEVAALNQAASEVGRLTTPTRDLEVIIDELQKTGYPRQAMSRNATLTEQYRKIAVSPVLDKLFGELDRWPELFRTAERAGELTDVKRQIQKALKKRINQLIAGLRDKHFDRHELRISVKNARYLTDAFPASSPLKNKSRAELKSVQASLGSWHDHHQWCLRVESERDLLEIAPYWQVASEQALADAELKLASLLYHLEKDMAKFKG
ncbi:CHAD domain-containing protein [Pseudomonas sp. PCH199]|uniref:CHAD domain-containing protein n=1 Tax=unclassified Pseudomonas TaxID=196821 RepID=UPI0015AEEA7D|nr:MULTISPECIES: CHAD domain-containing protein [unclassified Pseudomonas]MCW8277410.1 CHAD domain-containing protein [Pseudomonas sp. PCH199]